MLLGRDSHADIALRDRRASRHHARISVHHGEVYVQDLDSTNGTWINGVRIKERQLLRPGDQILVGDTQLRLVRAPVTASPGRSPVLLVGALLGGLILLIAAVLLGAASIRHDGKPDARSEDPLDLARRATVLISALDVQGRVIATGSGSCVNARGYILASAHVIENADVIVIAINHQNEDLPPVDTYQAEIVGTDVELELVILKPSSLVDGTPLPVGLSLPAVPVGDSDTLHIGDEIVLMGFPDVGGSTITLTRGSVAGFHEDGQGNSRGWIKTDAEFGPGNSGGAALNTAGELIGVPTWVSSESRTLGRIGTLRPVNLARDLLWNLP